MFVKKSTGTSLAEHNNQLHTVLGRTDFYDFWLFMQFWIGSGILRPIIKYIFCYFQPLFCDILFFVLSQVCTFREDFFLLLKEGQYGYQNIQSFMLILDPQNKNIEENSPEKIILYFSFLFLNPTPQKKRLLCLTFFWCIFLKYSFRSEISIKFWIVWHLYWPIFS